MPDIIQRIRDAYADNQATALKLLPELFKAVDDGKIVESDGTIYEIERLWCRICQKDHCRIVEKSKDIYFTREAAVAALQEREKK